MNYKLLTICLGLALFTFGLSPGLAKAQGPGCCVITVDDDEILGAGTSFDVIITDAAQVTICTVAAPLLATDDATSAGIFTALTTGAGCVPAATFRVVDETETTCVVTGRNIGGGIIEPVTACNVVVTPAAPAPMCQRVGAQFVPNPVFPAEPFIEIFDVDHLNPNNAACTAAGVPIACCTGAGTGTCDAEGGICGANPAAGAGGTIAVACKGPATAVAGLDDNAASIALSAFLGGAPAPVIAHTQTPCLAGPAGNCGAGFFVPSIVIPWAFAVIPPGGGCSVATANVPALPLGLDRLWISPSGGADVPGQTDLIALHSKFTVPALSAFGMVAFLLLATGGYFVVRRRRSGTLGA